LWSQGVNALPEATYIERGVGVRFFGFVISDIIKKDGYQLAKG